MESQLLPDQVIPVSGPPQLRGVVFIKKGRCNNNAAGGSISAGPAKVSSFPRNQPCDRPNMKIYCEDGEGAWKGGRGREMKGTVKNRKRGERKRE